jgi:Rrf2 family protein
LSRLASNIDISDLKGRILPGMLKLTKKADYGLMAMKHLAEHADQGACSAKDVADAYRIPQEALAKILQRLVKAGLLHSQHGTNGGYTLARDPGMISAFEVIRAIDGPLFITSCVTVRGQCDQSDRCNVREPLRRVSHGIEELLRGISILEMTEESGNGKTRGDGTKSATEFVTIG